MSDALEPKPEQFFFGVAGELAQERFTFSQLPSGATSAMPVAA
jgi:hypothetical protein